MTYLVELTGEAIVEVTALGIGDAEHQVEKIARSRCDDASVEILDIRRSASEAKLAEHFRIRCRVRVTISMESDSAHAARRAALQRSRERFAGTGFWSMEWKEPKLREGTS